MIKIELVRRNGVLVGRRFQDVWNLEQLGYTSLKDDRHQSEVKKFRRFYGQDFKISVVKGEQQDITPLEFDMFGHLMAA
jgi:hypothetical protein